MIFTQSDIDAVRNIALLCTIVSGLFALALFSLAVFINVMDRHERNSLSWSAIGASLLAAIVFLLVFLGNFSDYRDPFPKLIRDRCALEGRQRAEQLVAKYKRDAYGGKAEEKRVVLRLEEGARPEKADDGR